MLTPSAFTGTLRLEGVVPFELLFVGDVPGIKMYGACTCDRARTSRKPRLCARRMGRLHCMTSCVHAFKEGCTRKSSSDMLWLHLAVVACRSVQLLADVAGACRAAAYLAVSIVLQSIHPEADIADVAAWVEVCKWSDPSWLPIESLQRRQPGVPTAATTPVSGLPRHCMRSPSVQHFAASMHARAAADMPQTSRHTIRCPSAGGSAVAGSSHTAKAVGREF